MRSRWASGESAESAGQAPGAYQDAQGDQNRQRQEVLQSRKLSWVHARGVQLYLIEPGKPNQNICIESFSGRLRMECLSEHWFTSLAHVRMIIKA